jgi:hypothetical protein
MEDALDPFNCSYRGHRQVPLIGALAAARFTAMYLGRSASQPQAPSRKTAASRWHTLDRSSAPGRGRPRCSPQRGGRSSVTGRLPSDRVGAVWSWDGRVTAPLPVLCPNPPCHNLATAVPAAFYRHAAQGLTVSFLTAAACQRYMARGVPPTAVKPPYPPAGPERAGALLAASAAAPAHLAARRRRESFGWQPVWDGATDGPRAHHHASEARIEARDHNTAHGFRRSCSPGKCVFHNTRVRTARRLSRLLSRCSVVGACGHALLDMNEEA